MHLVTPWIRLQVGFIGNCTMGPAYIKYMMKLRCFCLHFAIACLCLWRGYRRYTRCRWEIVIDCKATLAVLRSTWLFINYQATVFNWILGLERRKDFIQKKIKPSTKNLEKQLSSVAMDVMMCWYHMQMAAMSCVAKAFFPKRSCNSWGQCRLCHFREGSATSTIPKHKVSNGLPKWLADHICRTMSWQSL